MGTARKLSRGARNIAWIEAHCRIPEGKFVGKPVKLTVKQRRWIKRIYDSPTRMFILSMARKNAKTALASFLLLLHLCGPEAQPNSQLFSAAQSRDQAGIVARDIVLERRMARRGVQALDVERLLDGDRHALQRSPLLLLRSGAIGGACGLQRTLPVDHNQGVKRSVQPDNTIEMGPRGLDRAQPSVSYGAGKLRCSLKARIHHVSLACRRD